MPSTFPVLHILGEPAFDYFFSLVLYFGLIAWFIAIPIRLVSRA